MGPEGLRAEVVRRLTAAGAPFEIREEPVRGQPMEVFAHRQRSLVEALRASAGFGEREYLVTEDRRISFAEHLDSVAATAAGLRAELGVRRGDRVAICAANRPEWIQTFWAAVSLGAVAVGMNSMWAPREMASALALTRPRVVVADRARRELLGACGTPVLSMEDELPSLVGRHAGAAPADGPDHAVDEDDPAVILFTSGTSGAPKGATHSHRNLIAAVWFHLLNDAVATELGAPPRDRRWLLLTPLFHIAALHNLAVVRLVVGDAAVIPSGRFDVDRVLRTVERERVTNWGAVPTMAARLVEHARRTDGLGRYDLSSLRSLTLNSAPSTPTLQADVRALLPGAAQGMGTSYGLTESTTAATVATPAELAADPATVGRPVPTLTVEVRDSAGRTLPEGVEGEVWLRGPQVMLGYWDDPAATAAAMTSDGWLRTGDLGTFSEGRLRISSRRSDLILRGGENVYPAEVENRLAEHPDVRECIVYGVPHPEWGEEVAAAVVVHPDATVSGAELDAFLRGLVAAYKVPTSWRVTTDELPRNATGKVDRAEVRAT